MQLALLLLLLLAMLIGLPFDLRLWALSRGLALASVLELLNVRTGLSPVVESFENCNNVSGKFGGVAGVFAGVHICMSSRKRVVKWKN